MGNNENLSVATKQAVYQLHSSYSIPTKGFTVTSVCVFRSWMGWVGNTTTLYILNVGVYDKAWVCEFLFLSIVSVIKMYSLNCRTVLLQDHSFLIISSELLCSSKMHIETYFFKLTSSINVQKVYTKTWCQNKKHTLSQYICQNKQYYINVASNTSTLQLHRGQKISSPIVWSLRILNSESLYAVQSTPLWAAHFPLSASYSFRLTILWHLCLSCILWRHTIERSHIPRF